jgi:hypothetical protein
MSKIKSKAIVKYLKSKNKILHNATGLILTPDNAIKEEYTRRELEVILRDISMKYDGAMCPYCHLYYDNCNDDYDNCSDDCPLVIADDPCFATDSSYYFMIKKLDDLFIYEKSHSFHDELKKAIETLKLELKKELEDDKNS